MRPLYNAGEKRSGICKKNWSAQYTVVAANRSYRAKDFAGPPGNAQSQLCYSDAPDPLTLKETRPKLPCGAKKELSTMLYYSKCLLTVVYRKLETCRQQANERNVI